MVGYGSWFSSVFGGANAPIRVSAAGPPGMNGFPRAAFRRLAWANPLYSKRNIAVPLSNPASHYHWYRDAFGRHVFGCQESTTESERAR